MVLGKLAQLHEDAYRAGVRARSAVPEREPDRG